MTASPDPVDYLRYVVAEGQYVLTFIRDTLDAVPARAPAIAPVIELLKPHIDILRANVVEAAAVFCSSGEDLDHYSDGRPVATQIDFGGIHFEYRWHPQPDHRKNQPQTLVPDLACRDGSRRSVIISASGHLDIISHDT